METELYRKYRPKKLSEVVGQTAAVKALNGLGKDRAMPHVLLLTGPSGTGKTTLARILANMLGCRGPDLVEVNAAEKRGIDAIRGIQAAMGQSPMVSRCRIWIIDECHALTPDAQSAFLKDLEDTPNHVYFMLATTDPNKLKRAILTRSTQVQCEPITESVLCKLIAKVIQQEPEVFHGRVSDSLIKRIARAAQGSARQALVILQKVIHLEDETDQQAVVDGFDPEVSAFKLYNALCGSSNWGQVADVLKTLKDEEPERLRRMILGCCKNDMLAGRKLDVAPAVFEEFSEPFFDTGFPGVVAAAYNVVCPPGE